MPAPFSPPPPPPPALSKTQQRKLARALAAQALADADPSASSSTAGGPDGPPMTADEAQERLDSVGSACSAVVSKRVKLLSKKAVSHALLVAGCWRRRDEGKAGSASRDEGGRVRAARGPSFPG